VTGSLEEAAPVGLGRDYRSKVDGTFAPGARLRQRELAELFQLSPTPVREGLQKLESEGLVQFDAHRGATVTPLPLDRLEEHLRILVPLEALAGELAVLRMTPERLAQLRSLAEEHASCAEGDPRIRDLNRNFHFCIYEAAESPMLITLLRFLWRGFPMGPQFWRPHNESLHEHALIVAALVERNVERTASLLYEHAIGSMELLHLDRFQDAISPLSDAEVVKEENIS
jgi:DNA-binding GntR family transcriptional regulator